MILKNSYWYFQKVLSDKFCNDIIKLALSKKDSLGVTGYLNPNEVEKSDDLKIQLFKKRNSNIVWLNEQWIYNELHNYVNMANKNSGWNFDWDWSETLQFTIYKENQHYGWHTDAFEDPYKEGSEYGGKIRKISMTVSLTDPSEYEGGDFEIDCRNTEPGIENKIICNEIKEKGSILLFPSHLWHRVHPVTRGTRYSLVMWTLGKPFK